MQSIGSMGIGLILAFIYGWKMSLVILAFVPFIMLAGAAETKLMIGFSAESKKRLLEGGKVSVTKFFGSRAKFYGPRLIFR